MKYDYDIITIGLGPAGMAVSIMGSEMGLKVCAIEKHKVGGECMNVGCIPSKALLRAAKTRHSFAKLGKMSLSGGALPKVEDLFERIQRDLDYIGDKKTMGMFSKVDMLYQEGAAQFVDSHTVQVGEKRVSAQRIFICTGTRPLVPDFPGINDVDYLTNENMFKLEKVPASMIIVGGGAIACEMAQAFRRLGSDVTMIIRGPHLIRREDSEIIETFEEALEGEGITILRNQSPTQFEKCDAGVKMSTSEGVVVEAEKLLIGAGRRFDPDESALDKAGVKSTTTGITVNKYLQTNKSHIFACGDCNGYFQFSHAAMHQGMIALMNSMIPTPFKMNFKNFVVPWTIFTDPQVSRVGLNEQDLKERGKKYEVVTVNYGDYGAAIAEKVDVGCIKAFISPTGKIYGAYIIGEGSGEMINEWALAIQKKMHITSIMMLQHSFPTMGFLTKRISETWMMGKMKSDFLKKMCRFMFRF